MWTTQCHHRRCPTDYDGPRGTVEMRHGVSRQQVQIARASDYEFDVLASLPQEPILG